MEGTVYTISPRLILPGGIADVPEGLTRRFWLTIRTPVDANAKASIRAWWRSAPNRE